MIKMWNSGAYANRDFSLLHNIYEFLDMIRNWKLHLAYPLINKVGQSFLERGLMTFSINVFWTLNCTLLLPNLLRPNVNFIVCADVDFASKKLHTRKYFQKKSSSHILGFILNVPFWNCSNVSNLKHRGAIIFLLSFW